MTVRFLTRESSGIVESRANSPETAPAQRHTARGTAGSLTAGRWKEALFVQGAGAFHHGVIGTLDLVVVLVAVQDYAAAHAVHDAA